MDNLSGRDLDVVRQEHRFLPDADEPVDGVTAAYEKALVRDFVIADLSRCEERMVGLRWRTEDEVRAGKVRKERCYAYLIEEWWWLRRIIRERLIRLDVIFCLNRCDLRGMLVVGLMLCNVVSRVVCFGFDWEEWFRV
jgi:hypothetical protein